MELEKFNIPSNWSRFPNRGRRSVHSSFRFRCWLIEWGFFRRRWFLCRQFDAFTCDKFIFRLSYSCFKWIYQWENSYFLNFLKNRKFLPIISSFSLTPVSAVPYSRSSSEGLFFQNSSNRYLARPAGVKSCTTHEPQSTNTQSSSSSIHWRLPTSSTKRSLNFCV